MPIKRRYSGLRVVVKPGQRVRAYPMFLTGRGAQRWSGADEQKADTVEEAVAKVFMAVGLAVPLEG